MAGFGGPSAGSQGTVDQFSQAALGQATDWASQAVHNTYTQLGLGKPAQGNVGGPHGTAAQAAASGQNLTYGGAGIPERMDLGTFPSMVGGVQGMAAATLGQLENAALNQGSGGGKGGGGGGLGGLGSIAGLAGGK